MKITDIMAIKESFFNKYVQKYEDVSKDAGLYQKIMDGKQISLDDQYEKLFSVKGDTATIKIFGPMSQDGPDLIDLFLGYNGTSYKNIIRATDEILNNEKITKVLLYCNTPGGNINGLDEAWNALNFMSCYWWKRKKGSQLSLRVINTGLLASAGVWLASAVKEVVASTPVAMTGSIGIIYTDFDLKKSLENEGIKKIVITNTDSPNKYADVSNESGIDIIKKQLDDVYGIFVDRVTAGRPITRDTIKNLKGEVIIAKDAVKIGLIDRITEGISEASDFSTSSKSIVNTENKIFKGVTLKMDPEVKDALEKITSAISNIAGRIDGLENKKSESQEQKNSNDSKALSDDDIKFSLNIITGKAYNTNVVTEAANVLAGKSSISTLKAMVAAVDAVNEQKNSENAKTESASLGETKPNGNMFGNKKELDGKLNTPEAVAAEIERKKRSV